MVSLQLLLNETISTDLGHDRLEKEYRWIEHRFRRRTRSYLWTLQYRMIRLKKHLCANQTSDKYQTLAQSVSAYNFIQSNWDICIWQSILFLSTTSYKTIDIFASDSETCSLQFCYITFSILFQNKSSLIWKSYTQKNRRVFKTNYSLVWKKNPGHILQTKFRLVWKILMTIVNVLKIQTNFSLVRINHWLLQMSWTLNQFQFYLIKSHFKKGKTQTYIFA